VVTLTSSKDPSPRRDTTTPKTAERSSYSQSDEMETEATLAHILVLCTQFNFTTPSQIQLAEVQSTKVQSTQVQSTQKAQSDQEDEGFTEVLVQKRRQGRPTTSAALSRAVKNIQDIRSTF
jgi:hypothetical protein